MSFRFFYPIAQSFIFTCVVALGLLGCSSDPIVTELDILNAENQHALPELYDRLLADKKKAAPSSDWGVSVRRNLDVVGKKIALKKEQKIIAGLQGEKVIYDTPTLLSTHDITTLDFSLKKAADIEKYNKEIYYGLVRQIEKAMTDKNILVKVKETEFKRLSDRHAVQKYTLLGEIAALSGGEKSREMEGQKQVYLNSLYASAEEALKIKRYEDVLLHLSNLEKIQPDYPGLNTLRDSLHAEELEQQFWDALGEGDTDKAYTFFYKLSLIPIYMENNQSIKPISEDMAKYFIAQGQSALSTYNLAETYKAFSRVRYIRYVLGTTDQYDTSEREFITFLQSRIKLFISNNELMHAYGFLSVLEEMDDSDPLLAELFPTLNEYVHKEAAMKLALVKVTQAQEHTEFVQIIDTQLRSDLSKLALSQIELVNDTDQLTSASVQQKKNPNAYHSFNAELLALNLNAVSTEQLEIKNVVTSSIRVENPEYIQWQQLSSRAKQGEIEPSSTVMRDVKKDVQIQHILHKKQIEGSMAYRVNRVIDNKVIVSDALSEIVLHQSKETQELRIGDFEQKAIPAALASDDQVKSELAAILVKQIMSNIVKSVAIMEAAYNDKAQSAYVAKQYELATHYFAYCNVLYKSEHTHKQDVLAKLRQSAMNWQ